MEKLGIPAPGFSLPNLNAVVKEQTVSLETFEEYPALLVVFICNHCPYVVHIRDSFVSFVSEYDEKGLGVVAISSNDVESYPDDSPEQMTEDAVKYSYPFPYLFDESQKIAKAYRAACTPDFFLYDRKRTLVYRGQYDSSRPKNSEPVTGEDLRNATNALILNSIIPTEQKPSMGCNIKWKKGGEPDYFAT
jgi:peroxiredoxin